MIATTKALVASAWAIPALPLLASAVIAALPARAARRAGALATSATAASCVAALAVAGAIWRGGAPLVARLPWFEVTARAFALSIRVDALAAIITLVVAVVSTAVVAYAAAETHAEPRRQRLLALLAFFVGAMLVLVLADDVLLFFLAWESVGLASYLLIGFWFERADVPRAATEAFLITRVGDMALLAGLLLLLRAAGTASLMLAATGAAARVAHPEIVLIAALLLTGAFAKSAQLPFSVWLPDAMVGPTPVSALLHSATMVAAGVYLVARAFPLFRASGSLPVVAWVGALSAIVGAWAALTEQDLKRLLAYSTISQIGFMFLGLGAGSVVAGVVLLVSQAFFKSLLFLCAGIAADAVAATALAPMGGLARRMRITGGLFALGGLALAGVPLAVAWPAKDTALAAAARDSTPLLLVALAAALLTAIYTTRAFTLAFLGQPRSEAAAHSREARRGLLMPMIGLGVVLLASAAARSPLLHDPLVRSLGGTGSEPLGIAAIALLVAACGIAIAVAATRRWPGRVAWPLPIFAGRVAASTFGLAAVSQTVASVAAHASSAAATIDSIIFDGAAVWIAANVRRAVHAARQFDQVVFDRTTTRITAEVRRGARAATRFDRARLDAAISAFAHALGDAGQRLRRTETGRVNNYLVGPLAWAVGALAAAGLVIWIRSVPR